MITWLLKKYILRFINGVLDDIKDNERVLYWKNKIVAVIQYLQSILAAIEDNRITDEECEKLIADAEGLMK